MKLNTCLGALVGALVASSAFAADLTGTTVVITNTFEGAFGDTVYPETDVAAFGLANNRFGTIGSEVEYPGFITLYDVDISGGAIAFRWIETEFSAQVSGPVPTGNHDRNYVVFDLPEGVSITAISFDAGASELLDGSAEPTAAVVGPNKVVTDFSDGVVRGVGFNPVFVLTLESK